MKKLILGALAAALTLCACAHRPLKDYTARLNAYDGALKPFLTLPGTGNFTKGVVFLFFLIRFFLL